MARIQFFDHTEDRSWGERLTEAARALQASTDWVNLKDPDVHGFDADIAFYHGLKPRHTAQYARRGSVMIHCSTAGFPDPPEPPQVPGVESLFLVPSVLSKGLDWRRILAGLEVSRLRADPEAALKVVRALKEGKRTSVLSPYFFPGGTAHLELLALLLQGYLAVHDAVDRRVGVHAAVKRDWTHEDLRPALELMLWDATAREIFDSTLPKDPGTELERRLEYLRGADCWYRLSATAGQQGLSVGTLLRDEWRGLVVQEESVFPEAIRSVADLVERGGSVGPPALVARCFMDVWPLLVSDR